MFCLEKPANSVAMNEQEASKILSSNIASIIEAIAFRGDKFIIQSISAKSRFNWLTY